MSKKDFMSLGAIIAGITIVIGYVSNAFQWSLAPYFIIIGGTLFALVQINDPYQGKNVTLKRLYRKQTFASLFIIAAGGCMLYTTGNEWIMLSTIAAAIYLYTAFRIPVISKKEE